MERYTIAEIVKMSESLARNVSDSPLSGLETNLESCCCPLGPAPARAVQSLSCSSLPQAACAIDSQERYSVLRLEVHVYIRLP